MMSRLERDDQFCMVDEIELPTMILEIEATDQESQDSRIACSKGTITIL